MRLQCPTCCFRQSISTFSAFSSSSSPACAPLHHYPPRCLPIQLLLQQSVQSGRKIRQQQQRWISSSQLTIESVHAYDHKNQQPTRRPANDALVFGKTMSDHMLMIEWNRTHQWKAPRIVPYQNLNISPAASCLHYGMQVFEGMKAYRRLQPTAMPQSSSDILMFRPDMNMKRLQSSMERLQMPGYDFDHHELLECIYELVRLDQAWIPNGEGYSLYIRPTVIATQITLGVAPPTSILLFVITSPVGPYYSTGFFQPVRLTTDTAFVRAWPGGTGNVKVGGNYAATMKPQFQATQAGYNQVLWLFGEHEDEEVTEVGAMNVFFLIRNASTQRLELITPPLTRGDILPGVTRDSILFLARTDPELSNEMDVSERSLTLSEILLAEQEGRLMEAFGAGTAAVVTPVEAIQYRGRDIRVPTLPGTMTRKIWKLITGIQYGSIQGPPQWSVRL